MGSGQSHSHLFTIGEFSKISGLTIKALRFYQEQGLLAPSLVDPQSGYRSYDHRQVETARVISYLRVCRVHQVLIFVTPEDGNGMSPKPCGAKCAAAHRT